MTENKAYESRVRYAAKRVGWRIEKSRARNLHSNDPGKYRLINGSNTVIGGVNFDASLDELEYWIKKKRASLAS